MHNTQYVFKERKFTMFEVSVAGGKTGLAVYLGVCDCKVLIAGDATAVPLVGYGRQGSAKK
jgi:hypothetical protein